MSTKPSLSSPRVLLYEAVADQIVQLIRLGTLRSGDRLPSVRAQSRQQGVSITTVHEAYRLLENKRYLVGMALLQILNLFSVSGQLGAREIRKRKAGIRAAVMLAHMGDDRSLAPLTRVFTTNRRRQSKYHELIEGALVRVGIGRATS